MTGRPLFVVVLMRPIEHARCQSLFLLKIILADTAERADPILRQILKCRSLIDSVIRITHFGIINISAYRANVFIHKPTPFPGPSGPDILWLYYITSRVI